MASTWGGTAIPAPTAYERSIELVGNQYLLSDGSLRTDYVTAKTRVKLTFANITAAERDTLITKFTTFSSAALVVEGETSENVIPVANSLSVSRLAGYTRAYTVTGEARTV